MAWVVIPDKKYSNTINIVHEGTLSYITTNNCFKNRFVYGPLVDPYDFKCMTLENKQRQLFLASNKVYAFTNI